jgi:hypothetical protein
MKAIFILTISIVLFINVLYGQGDDIYSTLRRYTVSIGYVDSTSINPYTKKKEKKFTLVGSGLATYNRLDTNIITSFVSAKHVIKFFEDSKLKSFWIRFS